MKCLLFMKISQNCKTIFYKTFSRNLVCFAIKVSKTFQKLLACFALKVSNNFSYYACLLALKVSKTFQKLLACLQ